MKQSKIIHVRMFTSTILIGSTKQPINTFEFPLSSQELLCIEGNETLFSTNKQHTRNILPTVANSSACISLLDSFASTHRNEPEFSKKYNRKKPTRFASGGIQIITQIGRHFRKAFKGVAESVLPYVTVCFQPDYTSS